MVSVKSVAAQTFGKVSSVLTTLDDLVTNEHADGIIALASEPVEIAVFGASKRYSMSQGRYVLREVFDEIQVIDFDVVEYEQSRTTLFIQGEIKMPAGQFPVRVYFRMAKLGEKWMLREIIFEREG